MPRLQLPSTDLHSLDVTVSLCFNLYIRMFLTILLTSLARDACALGSTEVEIEVLGKKENFSLSVYAFGW